jgi:hypothetical protein
MVGIFCCGTSVSDFLHRRFSLFGNFGFVTFRFRDVVSGLISRTPFQDLRFRTFVPEHFV